MHRVPIRFSKRLLIICKNYIYFVIFLTTFFIVLKKKFKLKRGTNNFNFNFSEIKYIIDLNLSLNLGITWDNVHLYGYVLCRKYITTNRYKWMRGCIDRVYYLQEYHTMCNNQNILSAPIIKTEDAIVCKVQTKQNLKKKSQRKTWNE